MRGQFATTGDCPIVMRPLQVVLGAAHILCGGFFSIFELVPLPSNCIQCDR